MSRPIPPRSWTRLTQKRRTRRHKVRRPRRPATAMDRNRHSTLNDLTLIIRNPSLTRARTHKPVSVSGLVDVGFAPKATELLRRRELTRRAKTRPEQLQQSSRHPAG